MSGLGPLIVDIDGSYLTAADEALLRHPLVGGIILFSRNYQDIAQLTALVNAIRACRANIIISVDQEGGRVQRLQHGFTRLPNLGSIGEYYDQDPKQGLALAETAGWLMAAEVLSVGIDVSFAPVLDIHRGLNSVIGDRSFHHSPEAIVALASAYIKGMNAAGMQAIGKHFPGHGGVSADSHLALPRDERDFDTISQEDMLVFKQLIQQQLLAGIMPAHIIYEHVYPEATTFSQGWLQDVLREQLHFSGVIFSDDLSMEGASIAGDYPSRFQAALGAGCDVILACNQRQQVARIIQECGHLQHDATDALSTFRGQSKHDIAQLQQQANWQQAHQTIQQFIEKGVTVC